MDLYSRLADLKLDISTYRLEGLKQEIPGGLTRHTTLIHFEGRGHTGSGEDVTYETDDQLLFQKSGPKLSFSGSYTLKTFSDELAKKELFSSPPKQEAYYNYRRWAFESAALSLALKQAGTSLAKALGLKLRPLNFVASTRLGEPSSAKRPKQFLKIYPKLRFKLDLANDWSDALINELANLKAIDTVDFKSFYKDTSVDINTDPRLYAKVLKAFPTAWIEDPDVNEDTKEILKSHADRLSWDAPIHSVEDIKDRPFPAKGINIKPSRFGSLKELFSAYNYCQQNNIVMYGGGQFELGLGRHQIQYLAALFHPDGPNDVAPTGYNSPKIRSNLPVVPLNIGEPF